MATVRVLNNILEDKVDTFSVNAGVSVEELIREHTTGNSYDGQMIECYDLDTGETYFAPIEDNSDTTNVIVQINGKDVGLDYKLKENDIVSVIITPAGGDALGTIMGGVVGAFVGGMIGFAIGGPMGALVGAGIGLSLGLSAGLLFGMFNLDMSGGTSSSGLDTEQLPDVRGSQNQPLTGQPFPMVLGKHLATPFIIGSPYNEISGTHGETNYIHCLYAVGYAPLRLTEFKLGEIHLAHNQSWSGNSALKNIFHGALHGTDTGSGSGFDRGDIVSEWANNDITLEILQQGNYSADYGSVYPYAKVQEDVKANVLYIASGDLVNVDRDKNISYKGLGLKNGMRNNHIHFSEQFPKTVSVELDFPNGLYKTRNETVNKNSVVKYYKIPMWVAIQWRVYSADNFSSSGERADTDIPLPQWNPANNTYDKVIARNPLTGDMQEGHFRGWQSFTRVNNAVNVGTYTAENRNADIAAHTGNGLTAADINNNWIGAEVFNLESLGGTNAETDGINEFRCITEVDLVAWAYNNLLTAAERESVESEEILAKKFRAYFMDGSNTSKSIEVRVVRVSPCYIDETVSTSAYTAFKFNDVFTWKTLTSTVLDGDSLMEKGQIVQKRPITEEDMKRLCVVALKAKTDTVDQLSNTIRKFSCMAESFAPYYDSEQKKWFPESVVTQTNYFSHEIGPDGTRPAITEQQFLSDRQNGLKSIRMPGGNNFVRQMIDTVIRTPQHIDEKSRYYIPDDDGTRNYCTNNVASMFLLAGIGPQLGNDALGYEQNFYDQGQPKENIGDFNMSALAKWHEWAEKVTDGSTYPSDGYHYDHNGNSVPHSSGEIVEVYFAANAYIYQTQTLEQLLSKIAVAGRALYTRDNKNRFTVVIDKPEKYPVALISQQNALKSSYTISFAQNPSGLQITYPDENDGYCENQLYCMADGEDEKHPKGAIEQYRFDFVTNNYQQYSLGRYLLANRILNKEVVTKTLGAEGASIGLGNLVLLQDDTMLIGTDTGGRITQLIENDSAIFGFTINNSYKYTGEEEIVRDSEGHTILDIETGEPLTRCKQGVIVMQPSQYQEARVITLRLAKRNTRIVVNGKTWQAKKGNTNVVLFERAISKTATPQDGTDEYAYKPKVDNIVGFGIVNQMTAEYRIVKIKPSANRTYEFTLMKYQEDLYSYGRKLPSFQNNMTVPDRSGEDSFALSNNVTVTDLVKALAEASELAQGRIDSTFGNVPPVPDNFTADVKQDCIQFTCTADTNEVNNISHITYEVTKYRLVNGVLQSKVETIDGSYSTEYFFDRSWEGYPEKKAAGVEENDGSLDFWKFRAKSVSIYLDGNGDRIESEWTNYIYPSASSLLAYGTWIPPAPTSISFVAEQEGITATWTCNTNNVYGSIQYEVSVAYDTTPRGTQVVINKAATYQFNRSIDGFPEKPGTVGMKIGTLTLDNYSVRIRATNVTSGKYSDSSSVACDYSRYKTWIPVTPKISSRVSNRNITLYLSHSGDCYGVVHYLVGVRRYDDVADTFYVPDLETNPYSRESAYKLLQNGIFKVGYIESESQFTQTMPLETQNGTQGMLDYDDSEQDNRVLAVPVDNPSDNRILVMSLGGFAPIDTQYQFEVYAFNKTVESFYDSASVVDHDYSKDTYHKVSVENARKNCIALATSVQDVLNGSIVSDKVGAGAITETKIEDDAISSPKIQANAVIARNMYAYNLLTLTEGAHSISGYAYNADTDEETRNILDRIKSGREDPTTSKPLIDRLDEIVKQRSNNYWIGLDTEHPEFYMGNVKVANKDREDANYFHYYYLDGETNLDIKLSNFIVTAVTSTIKGFFNVRNKKGPLKYTGANSFLQVNPESSEFEEDTINGYYDSVTDRFYEESTFDTMIEPDAASVFIDLNTDKAYRWNTISEMYSEVPNYSGVTPAEAMVLKGNLIIDKKNSDGVNGTLTVRGLSNILGELKVGNSETATPANFYGLATFLNDVTVGTNQQGLSKNLTVNGALSVTGLSSLTNILAGVTGASDNDVSLQVGKSGQGNERNARIYGTLYAKSINGSDGIVSDTASMVLSSGIPSQSAGVAKMYKDALALRGIGNDAGWVRFFETNNDGSLEIATGDDGTEPIYVRQYNTSSQVVRTVTLLDDQGNSSFPGTVTMNRLSVSRLTIPYGPPTNPQIGDIWLE